MRILGFDGEVPKIKPQALSQVHAQYAENVDLYGGLLRPHRLPQFQMYTVDERGRPITDPSKVAMFAMIDRYAVGFPTEVHWVRDPRQSAGASTILFVRDGKLWRLSHRMVEAGTGPTRVGIDAPEKPPVAAVDPGNGCKTGWAHKCQPIERECDPHADAPEVRGYRMTYVNECLEESAPTAPSNLVDVRNGDGVILVDTNTPPADAIARRYYRSATTSDGDVAWLFVGEDVIADTTFIDDVCPEGLGEVLPTEHHKMPSDCIEGVALGRNLQTIVWTSNQYWVSDPKLPNAYRPATRTTLPYDIQFIADYTPIVEGDTHYEIAIATKGYPYAAQIRDDGQSTVRELGYWYPALSPFGWTVQNGQVFYTAEAGLVSLAGSKVSLVTEELMTENEWADFAPAAMRLTGFDQRIFMWYPRPDRSRAGAVLVLPAADKRRTLSFSRLTVPAKMAAALPDLGMLMLIGSEVWKWAAGTGYMRYTWWSKAEVNSARWAPVVFKVVGDTLPRSHRNLTAAAARFRVWRRQHCDIDQVQFFDAHPEYRKYMVQLLDDATDVEFTLYCDGEEFYNRAIHSDAPVMLKRKKRGIEWSIKVSGTAVLRELHLQKSRSDLQNDGGHA